MKLDFHDWHGHICFLYLVSPLSSWFHLCYNYSQLNIFFHDWHGHIFHSYMHISLPRIWSQWFHLLSNTKCYRHDQFWFPILRTLSQAMYWNCCLGYCMHFHEIELYELYFEKKKTLRIVLYASPLILLVFFFSRQS